ncbi:transmembrane protein 106A [Chiloscyllium plagiosum]|uniref:transmembrane protein 106A n=1 Tax=Chiloscyllium plagiosum TaxID=36176 RepID=UPI001CB81766|nr:transmembrane protein 106A [Chiloscyllium plagiosum]XP_043530963.1 transmembrane protein 106A [Chiloscyllium plagiosum]
MGKSFSHLPNFARQSKKGDAAPIVPETERTVLENTNEIQDSNGEASSHVPYVEFVGRESITCPTCQGTGRIPRGQENELVALIPYSDQRLQPQRTKLYVAVAVLISLLISGLAIFFLFPRSIKVEHVGIKSAYITDDTTNYKVILKITNIINVTNYNFYSISITDLNVQIVFFNEVLGTVNIKNTTVFRPLGGGQIFYEVTAILDDLGMYHYCTMPEIKVHNIVISIQATVTAWYLSHSEQVSFDAYQYVDCGSNTTHLHSPYYPSQGNHLQELLS